jgi:signal transduction histidine kinase
MSVVVDPLRAERVLGLASAKLSEHVGYIYRKQLEEAEIVVINKCDLVTADQLQGLREAISVACPGAQVFEISARDGTGLVPWFETLLADRSIPRPIGAIDYDLYADGEALLGWLNAEIRLGEPGGREWDGNAMLTRLLEAIRAAVAGLGHEIAHLKATLSVEGDDYELAAANLVRSAAVAELSHRLTDPLDVGRLLINLRAEADPAILELAVREALETVRGDLVAGVIHSEHFRPGRPVPTHRIPA